MTCILERFGKETTILLTLSIILVAGFALTRVTKRVHLPKVSGYILAGILIGPHVLGLIPEQMVENMTFVSDIALAFIAFDVGRFFTKDTLRRTGAAVTVITLFESLLAGALVTVLMVWIFKLDLSLALLLGAIATATAPASTLMTIRQYHARGEFVDTLLQVVALDDVVCLLVFSIAAAVVTALEDGAVSALDVALPLVYNLGATGVGALFALLLNHLLQPHRSTENRLILAVALLLGLSGLCSIFDVSPLLSCMIFGAVYRNKTGDEELYSQLTVFTPPIMLLFFVISGMSLDVGMLAAFGLVGVAYFIIRIAGKYAGAYLGCLVAGTSKSVRNWLGAALIPQAGVAIGLAYLAQRILPERIGGLLMTIILSSCVLYELIGPACAKIALFGSGAIKRERKPSLKIKKRKPAEPSQPLIAAEK